MRQLLLLFTLFLSVAVFGQKQKTVTFDFTSPSSLNLPTANDSEITNENYSLGKVNLSFSKGSIPLGVRYIKENGNYYLRLSNSSKAYFSTSEGATLTSVKFNTYTFGDLSIANNQPGSWDDEDGSWSCLSNTNVQSVVFMNSGANSYIKSVTVSYTEPTQILTPSPYESQLNVSSFSNLTLNFGSRMTKVGTQALSLVSGTSSYPMSANVNNSVVTLSLTQAITTDGTYTLNIPAGYFQNAEGYSNKALTYTIVVSTPKNILNYVSVSPETAEIEKLESPIVLTYDEHIKSFSKELMIKSEGKNVSPAIIQRSSKSSKQVIISFDIPEGITDKGIYTIEIPEGTINTQVGEIYNPTFTLTYKVGYKPAPVYSETMKKAIALVAKSGVGYPATNSESRKNLATLISAEETPSDESLLPAIDAFYNEENVERPAIGKWYYISSSNAGDKVLYLSVKDGKLGVTTQKSEATAFEVVEPMMFRTVDGKYLFTASVEDNIGTKSLELKKLVVSGVEAEKLLGYFSMFGYYETTKAGKVLQAYASVDFSNNKIATDDHDTAPVFNSDYSGAFAFTETVKPSDKPSAVDMHCVVSPSVVKDDTGKLTLTFTDSKVIEISDNAEGVLCTDEGSEIQKLSLLADSKQTDVAIVIAGNLQDGKYKIVIPAGSISYTANEKQFTNNEFTVSFEVKKGTVNPDPTPDPTPSDFKQTYTSYLYYPSANIIKDVDLNDFTIGNSNYNYPEKPQGFVVDETKTVILKQVDTVREIRRGHFEKVSSMPNDPDCPDAYKIVFDTPITEGELKADNYTFFIEAATFGDANFGKYLADKTSVSSSFCYVNPSITVPFVVNNELATSIKNITTGNNQPTVIYDLMGRRIQEITRPGIYIVNGKKVVKK